MKLCLQIADRVFLLLDKYGMGVYNIYRSVIPYRGI